VTDLLDIHQAAELLGLSPETLYGYRYRQYLAPPGFPIGFKVGGRVKWHRADLDAWIDKQRSGQANGQPSR
jgi:predicted DNA-binding transcriptional regulator AlpA